MHLATNDSQVIEAVLKYERCSSPELDEYEVAYLWLKYTSRFFEPESRNSSTFIIFILKSSARHSDGACIKPKQFKSRACNGKRFDSGHQLFQHSNSWILVLHFSVVSATRRDPPASRKYWGRINAQTTMEFWKAVHVMLRRTFA